MTAGQIGFEHHAVRTFTVQQPARPVQIVGEEDRDPARAGSVANRSRKPVSSSTTSAVCMCSAPTAPRLFLIGRAFDSATPTPW